MQDVRILLPSSSVTSDPQRLKDTQSHLLKDHLSFSLQQCFTVQLNLVFLHLKEVLLTTFVTASTAQEEVLGSLECVSFTQYLQEH